MSLALPAPPASPGQRRPQGSLPSFPPPCQDPGAHSLQGWVWYNNPHQPDGTYQCRVRGTEAQVRRADLFQS